MDGRFKNTSVALSDTNLTTVYTCPAKFTAIIREIFLTNVDGSAAVDATLKYTETSDSATCSWIRTKRMEEEEL